MNLNNAITKLSGLPLTTRVELLFYPIFLLWRMPIAWVRSLWGARILLDGQWRRYMGFHPQNAINSLFYRTQWINLDRYGRSGVSPILGLGAYPLRNWFHLSLLASYIYANAGAVTTLLGTLFWVLSHLVWLDKADPWWVVAVTGILFFSTTAYAMAFARQNYQILGWMWLPLALYGVSTDQWALATVAWFAAGLAGITPVFFGVPILFSLSLLSESVWPLLTLVPALALTATRFLPLLKGGQLKQSLVSMARMIGMTKRNVRYNREINRWNLFTLYFFGLYLASALGVWWFAGEPPILLLVGATLFLVNQRIFRVADEQSTIILNASMWALVFLSAENNWKSLGFLWLAVSPFGVFLSVQYWNTQRNRRLSMVGFLPFDIEPILYEYRQLFSAVKPSETVYSGFNDPQGLYGNIFDGYRVIHEASLCIAAEKGFHLMPDWWAVQETNYQGSPQCWGRAINEVLENCDRWHANFVLVYGRSGSEICNQWLEQFELISQLDWKDLTPTLGEAGLWQESLPTPIYFLLKRRVLSA